MYYANRRQYINCNKYWKKMKNFKLKLMNLFMKNQKRFIRKQKTYF